MNPKFYFRLFQERFSVSLFFALLKHLSNNTTWVECTSKGHYKILAEEEVMNYLQSYAEKHKATHVFVEEEKCNCCQCCCKRCC